MKLIKNEADYTISDVKENYGAQKIGALCRYLDHQGMLKKKGANQMNYRYYPLRICPCIYIKALEVRTDRHTDRQ